METIHNSVCMTIKHMHLKYQFNLQIKEKPSLVVLLFSILLFQRSLLTIV